MSKFQRGYADIVIGTQYGDEGKARVIDDIANNYDIIARFNGGPNAGHTIEANGIRIALRQVPSAVLHGEKLLYVGSGCVIDLEKLRDEIASIEGHGVYLKDRLRVSSQASVIQPHHKLIDEIIGGEIGTTKNGIGPAYSDRAIRMNGSLIANVRLGDLVDNPDKYFTIIENNFRLAQQRYGFQTIDLRAIIESMRVGLEDIKQYIELDTLFVQKKIREGSRILFEGAQSFMLDVNKGSVPYVTASPTNAAAAFTGGDLPPNFHGKTIGVVKAVMSRVGHGPFVSEFGGKASEEYCMAVKIDGLSVNSKKVESELPIDTLIASNNDFEVGQAFRVLSNEYGTVTGRPRRVGNLDLVQLRHAVAVNGIDEIVITKCDLLRNYSSTTRRQLAIVVGYKLDGKEIDYIPGSTDSYRRVEPIYEYMNGFSEDITTAKTFKELPEALKIFIDRVEKIVGCKVRGVSVGPDRCQYIQKS